MKSRFHEAAHAELSEAVAYYDHKAPGLGDRFLTEVKAATRNIEQYPEIAPVIEEGVRAKVLVRFPYSLGATGHVGSRHPASSFIGSYICPGGRPTEEQHAASEGLSQNPLPNTSPTPPVA
jgi:hypothetical protein